MEIMEEFIKEVNKAFRSPSDEKVLRVFDVIKDELDANSLYCKDFAIAVARDVVANKLDYKSVIVSLVYSAYKVNPSILQLKTLDLDKEELSMLESIIKIEKLDLKTRQEQLDNIKNMFMAIAKDIRVIIIKLCIEQTKFSYLDRLTEDEVSDLMRESNDLYFPIAAMLGLSKIKNTLGNATFKYYKPSMHEELSKALVQYVGDRNEEIQSVIKRLKVEIRSICDNVTVYGRQKQLFSIAKKLQNKNMGVSSITDIYGRNNNLQQIADTTYFKDVSFHQIMDILAVRVLVDTVEQCYSALGKIFSIFKPLGNFKDYIANPKENGYQSIHTSILLDSGDPIEVQIRTYDMHNYAEYGYAAHWAYKDKKKVDESGIRINYIRSVLDMYKQKSSDELLDALKTDVYSGKIFVQTPMGKIIELPEGANCIDFAYAIHSKVGNTCVGAKINSRMVPLTTILSNGDMIEIITNPNAKGPSRDWLKIVKSDGARTKINAFFKKEMKEDNIKKGKSMFEMQAKVKNMNLTKLMKPEYLEEAFDRYSLSSIDDMYASIGYGALTANQILTKLTNLYNEDHADEIRDSKNKELKTIKNDGEISVKGYGNLFTKLAKCCNPIPGDNIIGYVSRGNGVTVHLATCPSIKNYEFERLIECTWHNNDGKSFIGSLSIVAEDNGGLIASISKKLNDEKISIAGMVAKKLPDNKASIHLQLNVKRKEDLDYVIAKLEQLSYVFSVSRLS